MRVLRVEGLGVLVVGVLDGEGESGSFVERRGCDSGDVADDDIVGMWEEACAIGPDLCVVPSPLTVVKVRRWVGALLWSIRRV